MLPVLLHLYGDFIFQNHWMAVKKVEYTLMGWLACLVHCIIYTGLFYIFLDISAIAAGAIFFTHFLIDKFRLAKYVTMLVNWRFNDNWGFPPTTAPYLAVWLLFIVDGIMHITMNYLILKYL